MRKFRNQTHPNLNKGTNLQPSEKDREQPLKFDWSKKVELAFVAIAAGSAAYSAYQSQQATQFGLKQSASTVLFQSRLEAQKQYIQAHGQLEATLLEIAATTPETQIDLEEPTEIDKLSTDDLKKVAKVTRRAIPAITEYRSLVMASRGVWSDKLEEKIAHVLQDAGVAAECYAAAGNPPMTDKELPRKRLELKGKCSQGAARFTDFQDAHFYIVGDMIHETREEMEMLGANRAPRKSLKAHGHN